MRAQLRFDGHGLSVRSRPARDCTAEFPELANLQDNLADRKVILDGELVSLSSDGKPDFAALRARVAGRSRRAAGPRGGQLTFMACDLLHLDGSAVRHLPYRRALLAELELDVPVCRTPRYFVREGSALLAATAEQGLEGVVAKTLDAPYAEGRRRNSWVKQSTGAASDLWSRAGGSATARCPSSSWRGGGQRGASRRHGQPRPRPRAPSEAALGVNRARADANAPAPRRPLGAAGHRGPGGLSRAPRWSCPRRRAARDPSPGAVRRPLASRCERCAFAEPRTGASSADDRGRAASRSVSFAWASTSSRIVGTRRPAAKPAASGQPRVRGRNVRTPASSAYPIHPIFAIFPICAI